MARAKKTRANLCARGKCEVCDLRREVSRARLYVTELERSIAKLEQRVDSHHPIALTVEAHARAQAN